MQLGTGPGHVFPPGFYNEEYGGFGFFPGGLFKQPNPIVIDKKVLALGASSLNDLFQNLLDAKGRKYNTNELSILLYAYDKNNELGRPATPNGKVFLDTVFKNQLDTITLNRLMSNSAKYPIVFPWPCPIVISKDVVVKAISDLGSGTYVVREKANRLLAFLGPLIVNELVAALRKMPQPPLEETRRLQRLIESVVSYSSVKTFTDIIDQKYGDKKDLITHIAENEDDIYPSWLVDYVKNNKQKLLQ